MNEQSWNFFNPLVTLNNKHQLDHSLAWTGFIFHETRNCNCYFWDKKKTTKRQNRMSWWCYYIEKLQNTSKRRNFQTSYLYTQCWRTNWTKQKVRAQEMPLTVQLKLHSDLFQQPILHVDPGNFWVEHPPLRGSGIEVSTYSI